MGQVIIAGPVLVLMALGIVSWMAGSVKGRAVAAAAGAWLWACVTSAAAWVRDGLTGKRGGGTSQGSGKVPAGKTGGKPVSPPGGKASPVGGKGGGFTVPETGGALSRAWQTARRVLRWAAGFLRNTWGFFTRSTGRVKEPREGSPQPVTSPQGKGGGKTGGNTQVPPAVVVKTTTTVTRTTRRRTPRDYTPHRAGDSGVTTTTESLRSHTVYGQTLAMVPAVTGTVHGYTYLIKRHRDEGEGHGLWSHPLDLWDIAVRCAADAEKAAEEASADPDDAGLRRAAEVALDAATDAVRDAAHHQATYLAALFEAADGTTGGLKHETGLSGLRAAA